MLRGGNSCPRPSIAEARRRNVELDAVNGRNLEAIDTFGWAVIMVGPVRGEGEPSAPFAYTIGLSRLDSPEVIIVGVELRRAGWLLNHVGIIARDSRRARPRPTPWGSQWRLRARSPGNERPASRRLSGSACSGSTSTSARARCVSSRRSGRTIRDATPTTRGSRPRSAPASSRNSPCWTGPWD